MAASFPNREQKEPNLCVVVYEWGGAVDRGSEQRFTFFVRIGSFQLKGVIWYEQGAAVAGWSDLE